MRETDAESVQIAQIKRRCAVDLVQDHDTRVREKDNGDRKSSLLTSTDSYSQEREMQVRCQTQGEVKVGKEQTSP